MPLLSVRGLTMRFAGLTAVDKVDFEVANGQIFSVIGPNGAGKTTVFNAITGIYAPTSGTIEFQGHELRRPFTVAVALSCLVISLSTGLLGFLVCGNIDGLWRVSIKNNNDDAIRLPATAEADFDDRDTDSDGQWTHDETTDETKAEFTKLLETADENGDGKISRDEYLKARRKPFSFATAWRDAIRHLRGEPYLAKRGAKWQVMLPAGERRFGSAKPKYEVAESERAKLLEAQTVPHALTDLVDEGDDGKSLLAADRTRKFFTFEDDEAAEAKLELIDAAVAEQRQQINRELIGLVVGLAVGGAGSYTVWQRSRRTPDVIALAGIARTFQNIRLFHNLTVLENVLVGMDRSYSRNALAMALCTPGQRRQENQRLGRAIELLEFVGLTTQRHELAKNLAYGQQRRLEIARALASSPTLLLLDEPAAGMNPAESADLVKLIRKIRDQKITVLLIEHHMKLVMDISDRIAVLNYGQKIAEGTPAEVRSHPKVIEAYLGKEEVS